MAPDDRADLAAAEVRAKVHAATAARPPIVVCHSVRARARARGAACSPAVEAPQRPAQRRPRCAPQPTRATPPQEPARHPHDEPQIPYFWGRAVGNGTSYDNPCPKAGGRPPRPRCRGRAAPAHAPWRQRAGAAHARTRPDSHPHGAARLAAPRRRRARAARDWSYVIGRTMFETDSLPAGFADK